LAELVGGVRSFLINMTKDSLPGARDARTKDTDQPKRGAGRIGADVKRHAVARVDEVNNRGNDLFDFARNCANEHPLKLTAAALVMGFLIGTVGRQ